MRTGAGPGVRALVVAVAVLLVTACGAGAARSGDQRELVVLAAASLTDALTDLAERFERDHLDVDVVLSFAGTPLLVAQVQQGVPADLVAVAAIDALRPLTDDDRIATPVAFARNTPVLVTPADNPGRVTAATDLARPELRVGLCRAPVPCATVAEAALRQLSITPAPDTREPDVRSLLTKVVLGELDAAVVYRSDAIAAGADVRVIPLMTTAATTYGAATVTDANAPDLAQDFLTLLTGPRGQQALAAAGFTT